VLLFQKRFQTGLVAGTVSLTFRQWDKPRVKPGGRYRVHPIGVVEVDGLSRVKLGEVSEEDARRSGFADRTELIEYMKPVAKGRLDDATELWRIELHHAGDGDRVSIALEDKLSDDDLSDLSRRLERMDADGPWTMKTLKLIEKHPRIAASKLAPKMKLETLPFKARVVKLKKLGLTQSFEVGYEVSPRGRAYLAKRKRR
jgi:hypothetical protein